jgi:hypothetical protein
MNVLWTEILFLRGQAHELQGIHPSNLLVTSVTAEQLTEARPLAVRSRVIRLDASARHV